MPLSHLIFELVVYLLAALCLWQTWRQPAFQAILLAGTFYGIMVEYVGLLTKGYHYGAFWIMLFPATYPIPLCIPVAWGTILYTTMHTSAYLGHSSWVVRGAISTVLALTLDFVMDPIASGPGGLGMWTWTPSSCQHHPLTLYCSHPQIAWLFGVPLANFIGWYFNVLSYSFFALLGWRLIPPGRQGRWVDLLIALVAGPLALGANVVWMKVLSQVTQVNLQILFTFACLMFALLVILWYAPFFRTNQPFDPILLSTPAFAYGYFIFWLVVRSRDVDRALLIFTPLMAALGIILYLWPYRQWLAQRLTVLRSVKRTQPAPSLTADPG